MRNLVMPVGFSLGVVAFMMGCGPKTTDDASHTSRTTRIAFNNSMEFDEFIVELYRGINAAACEVTWNCHTRDALTELRGFDSEEACRNALTLCNNSSLRSC